MAQIEPMDIDSGFDNKENSLHHSNVLSRTPCTEKGYEELDVSELNMKLRYSITPASSPMSKSFTANCLDKTFDSEDYLSNVVINENCNLTRSLNSTITRNDMAKVPKSLPLQVLSSESITDNRNTSILCSLDKTPVNQDRNVTITLGGQNYLDDNMSLPSTSSTPEAITPTKETPKIDGGSPIMRGLKSVLNMFRSSQSPIPPADVNDTLKQEILSPKEPILNEYGPKSHQGMASTPISNKQREVSSSQRSSPLKDSIIFNDDLERELQWKDETTILFKEEKIPIHKLLLPQSLSSLSKTGEATSIATCLEREKLNNTVEHMDISYNDSFSDGMAGRFIQSANVTNTNDQLMIESDGEFVDCETTINNDNISQSKIIDNLTSSMSSKNVTLQESHNALQVHTEQQLIVTNQSETTKNLSLKEFYSQNCDKNEIFTNIKDDGQIQEIQGDSVIRSHDLISNTGGVVVTECQNVIVSEIIEHDSSDQKLKELNEPGLINNNGSNLQINIPNNIVLGEQNMKIEEPLPSSKHPSDIPLPDEDDIENVLNLDPATHQKLNLKVYQQMDMTINHHEKSMNEKNCLQSKIYEFKEIALDCIYQNETILEKINEINNQEIVPVNANNDELMCTQCTDQKDLVGIINSNDNLTLNIESASLEETKSSVTPVDVELNLETNGKLEIDSLEKNNDIPVDAVTRENETKCNLSINESQNNIICAQAINQSADTENVNEIAANKESSLQNVVRLEQEQERTFIFEKDNLEKIDNVDCTYLGTDNRYSRINNDSKDLGLTEKLEVFECEASIETQFENNSVCMLQNISKKDNLDTTTIPESLSNTFIPQDNKILDINLDNTQEGQESQDVKSLDETISQGKCPLKIDNTFNVLQENTKSRDVEKPCNEIKNIESITLVKEELVIGGIINKENILPKDSKETIIKEVTQTLKQENCTSMSIENELSMHLTETNVNISLEENEIIEKKEIEEKPNEYDPDTNTLYSHVHKENEIVQNNNLNNEINPVLINHVNSNATFNMSIDQEGEIENKVSKEKASECDHKTSALNIHVLESESLDNIHNVIVPNVTEECDLNQHSGTVYSSTLDVGNCICQKEEIEAKIYECKINALNIGQQHMLDSNNVIINEAKNCDLNLQGLADSSFKIDNQVDSNIASYLTLNMSIDHEDLSQIKEIDDRDEYENLLNIRPKENKILPSDKLNSLVVNESEECNLYPQNIIVSNSNIDNLAISNSTFDMSMGNCENMSENNQIKENIDKYEFEADETGDCAIDKQNVIITNSELNNCTISNITCNAEDDNPIVQLIDQTQIELENNTEPVFLQEVKCSPSNKLSIEIDAMDETKYLDSTNKHLNMDCEIKNDQTEQVKNSMDKSMKILTLSSENANEKGEIENLDKKLEDNFEIKYQESPPLSPVISSKGYNFNFDEIDDPFATKTKIRLSPTPEDSPGSNEKFITKTKSANINKKDFQRRKSMPLKRQPPSLKSKINSTFSEAVEYNDVKQCTKTTEKMDTEIEIVKSCDNSQVSVNLPSTSADRDSVQSEETREYCIDGLTKKENVDISDEHFAQIETSSQVETTPNVIKSTSLSVDKREAKNVFNLPEMSSDMNFSPFTTKYKVCRTPSPVLGACAFSFTVPANSNEPSSEAIITHGNIISDVPKLHVGSKVDNDSSTTSSSSKATEDATVLEVNTEDEDTVEGPFFEADDLNDDEKIPEFVGDSEDMMNFNDVLPQGTADNVDNGEMFIDAEAFEFLLNQNKSNMVVDSGKESLFLKFDPLFAKRMSSDGVLAALNKVQKRQSTPKRISKAPTLDFTCDKMSTGTSNLNATTDINSTLENNFEDPNTTISKPMMVVNPAVNSIISPRNKPVVTPPRANRRSLTFTSPAIAVIDRLLSLSGNNSLINNDTPTQQVRREPNETDLALTQLRELLAEKEIHVHNLRLESKELKERLSTLENQVISLESESEQRLRKVNELNERLVEKTNINRSMAAVVEEYERTIASLIAETEQDKKRHAEERMRLVNERDEQTAHLASMEISFNDLHSKYEKSKQVILACKSNEDMYRRSIKEFEESQLKMQNNYELLKQHATTKLNQANQELERLNRAHEAEVVKLNAMIKRKDLHITSLEETLAQKTKANEELTAICDELINKVG